MRIRAAWLFLLAGCAQTPGMVNREREVRELLDAQVAAWNRGELSVFLDAYARGQETTFISGGEVTHGFAAMAERYRERYATREEMGTLSFTELEVRLLSADAAVVHGHWTLVRASDVPSGRFTLILRRLAEGWRIVHDHTSVAGE